MRNHKRGVTAFESCIILTIIVVLLAIIMLPLIRSCFGKSEHVEKAECQWLKGKIVKIESSMNTGSLVIVVNVPFHQVDGHGVAEDDYNFTIDVKNDPQGPQTNNNLAVRLKVGDNVGFPVERAENIPGSSREIAKNIFPYNGLGILTSNEIKLEYDPPKISPTK